MRKRDNKMLVNRFLCAIHGERAGPRLGCRAFLRPAGDPGLPVVYKARSMKEVRCLTAGLREGLVCFAYGVVSREQAPGACTCLVSW